MLLWTVVVLLGDPTIWLLIVGGVSLTVLAADVLWLTYRVRRDLRHSSRH